MNIAVNKFVIDTGMSVISNIAKDIVDNPDIVKTISKEVLYQFYELYFTQKDKNVDTISKIKIYSAIGGTCLLPIFTKHHYFLIVVIPLAYLLVKGETTDWAKFKARKVTEDFFYYK